jgi:hypothetical protein
MGSAGISTILPNVGLAIPDITVATTFFGEQIQQAPR